MVVNDLGGSVEGDGSNAGPASRVCDEITSAGGVAVPDQSDIGSGSGARALIDKAVEHFGRIDIVINNAGIMRWAALPEADQDNLDRHLSVHTVGSFNTIHAAWPHMVTQGYGRIVMTTSTGMFGLANNLSYATAKAAVIGLTRSLAVAGARHGIKANLIAPAALTRMAGPPGDDGAGEGARKGARQGARQGTPPGAGEMAPDLVAPMVAFLAHEACPVTGEIYAAGAQRFARMFIACTPGYLHPGDTPTIEDVAQNWATINDETGYWVPSNLMDWSATFMAHLQSG